MFIPEKILSGLIRGGMRRSKGLGAVISDSAALGLAGIAMETAEHFINRTADEATSCDAPNMPSSPPFEVPAAQSSLARQAETVVLIRAMIAAAYADGAINEHGRAAIAGKLRELALSSDEEQFVSSELLAPKTRRSIVAAVTSPEMARQVYAVSLLAIVADTDSERRYLCELAQELALDRTIVEQLHQQVGVPLP